MSASFLRRSAWALRAALMILPGCALLQTRAQYARCRATTSARAKSRPSPPATSRSWRHHARARGAGRRSAAPQPTIAAARKAWRARWRAIRRKRRSKIDGRCGRRPAILRFAPGRSRWDRGEQAFPSRASSRCARRRTRRGRGDGARLRSGARAPPRWRAPSTTRLGCSALARNHAASPRTRARPARRCTGRLRERRRFAAGSLRVELEEAELLHE